MDEYFSGMEIYASNHYFNLLSAHFSFEEIEKLDLVGFNKVFPECLKGENYDKLYLDCLKILNNMDFTALWDKHIMPFLQEQCAAYNALFKDAKTTSVFSDVQRIKPNEEIGDVTIYLTYFSFPISFRLSDRCYLTSHAGTNGINANDILSTFAHELIHGFSNEALRGKYLQAIENDMFLAKTKDVLFYKVGSPSAEEEFVVALEYFISYKNGLFTKDELYGHIFNHYNHCMPLAVIVFDELVKYGKIPADVNTWILKLFEDGVIRNGGIEGRVNQILPGYSNKFKEVWVDKLS